MRWWRWIRRSKFFVALAEIMRLGSRNKRASDVRAVIL